MDGWVKLHRVMQRHAVWALPDAQFKVWIFLLLQANHAPRDTWLHGERITIPMGYLVRSQRGLATDAGVGRQVIRDVLRNLENIGSIKTHKRTQRKLLIEIVNWPTYQGSDVDENPKENQKRTQEEPMRNPTQEGKELKKSIRAAAPAGFDAFWAMYPKKRSKETAKKAWATLAPQNGLVETILAAVALQKQTPDWLKDGGQFIPYAATWLHRKQWEDEISNNGHGPGQDVSKYPLL